MTARIVVTCAFLIFLFRPLQAQVDVSLFDYWKYYSDAENALYKSFCAIAFDQLESRQSEISKLRTKADWLQRQTMVREKLKEIIGPLPEKTPLNTRITGTLQKDGYGVEKLIFESQPGYYVTAALFIPDNLKEKAPAVLNPIGHSTASFRRDVYQHQIINLVKKGFIVLAYDPIGQGERLQYYDPELGKSKFPSNHEHSYPGAQCYISGYSSAKYFIWDGIRAIDVLLARPEVDPERIGITGISGGGTSTAQIAAIDDRIHAAAPECYITNFNYLFKSEGPQDSEQNLVKLIYHGLDHPDYIEVRAPKPTLIMSTTRDFFSIQGARETFREAGMAYAALGAKENLQMTEDDDRHSSTRKNREALYAFFQEHLNNPGDPNDHDVDVFPESDLWATETGHLATSLPGETMHSLNRKIVARQLTDLDSSRVHADKHLAQVQKASLEISGFTFPDEFGEEVFSGRLVTEEYQLEKYLIPGSGDYMLPLALLSPVNNNKGEVVLLLHELGKDNAINQDSLARQLLANGHSVLLADLPDIGEMGPGYLRGDTYIDNVSYNKWYAGILIGKSIVGLRAEDITRLVHFVKNKLPGSPISAVSVGVLGSELLHAASFENDIQQICLIRPFLSYSEIALSPDYQPSFIHSTVAGAIDAYDLPDLMAILCPRKLLLINPVSGSGQQAPESKAQASMHFPTKVYSNQDASDNFILHSSVNNQLILEKVLSWLE